MQDQDLQPGEDETLDELLRGRVRLLQSRKGYRTSVDAMALAWFALDGAQLAGHAIDLGAGSGLVAILLGLACPQLQLHLIERQPLLAARAKRNLDLNGLQGRAAVIGADLANPPPALPAADLVVCNPPYYLVGARMPPQNAERRAAHCESTAPLERFAEVAAALLAPQGAACFVYPSAGAERLLAALAAAGLGAREVCLLWHREGDAKPVRVLVRARLGPEIAVKLLPDRYLHAAADLDHTYTANIEAFLRSLGPSRELCG